MKEIQTVAVIGAGTMGHSLALVFAQEGLRVWLNDLQEEILIKARELITSQLRMLVEVGELDKEQECETLGRIQTTTRIEEAGGKADFVIEAVTENQAVKKRSSPSWTGYVRQGQSWPATPLTWISSNSSRRAGRKRFSSLTGSPRPTSSRWWRWSVDRRPLRTRWMQ
jgi:threonine dehydrogenase-like Zn-dependent dehydrogenase